MKTYTTLSVELEELTKYTEDSAKGFDKAAGLVKEQDRALSDYFANQSKERTFLAEKLNDRLECIGRQEQEGGTFMGAVHRRVLDLKDFFNVSDPIDTVIEEAIRGEEMLKDFIADALNNIDVSDGESERVVNDLKNHVEASVSTLRSRKSMT